MNYYRIVAPLQFIHYLIVNNEKFYICPSEFRDAYAFMYNMYIALTYLLRPVARAEACDCKYDRLWDRFPLKEMKYLIFPFMCVIQHEANIKKMVLLIINIYYVVQTLYIYIFFRTKFIKKYRTSSVILNVLQQPKT